MLNINTQELRQASDKVVCLFILNPIVNNTHIQDRKEKDKLILQNLIAVTHLSLKTL